MATTLRTSGVQMGSSVMDVSGSAPSFTCRHFVNFNGQTGLARESGNLSSVGRLSVGAYFVNFQTTLPSGNYALVAITDHTTGAGNGVANIQIPSQFGYRLLITIENGQFQTVLGDPITIMSAAFI